jgi:GTP cyclohydrolase IA
MMKKGNFIFNNSAIQGKVGAILDLIGEDRSREGLKETPARVAKSYGELFSGYEKDPKALFKTFDSDGYDQIIICKDIEFYSTCEHHMLPFFGKIHIGYVPDGKVIGLSKMPRLVEIFARRLQIQERLTIQIATELWEGLKPKAVGVVVEAVHFCMIARGVQKQNASMVTSDVRGAFRDKPEARDEFLKLIGKGHNHG